ncbi:type VI secretion system protein TssA [Aquicoccus sp. G2-2]|uniref:type VI secretion system protein TssA n=1 Tax=Aquicoccus sp. G2-2 TaxID=3092120 RepID=UPI002ADF6A01|nr:type VI secretion system protein TssA [Aquicoccus sp. G2-2]MEA1114690.1 type VI secretion system protein TssA [Aquicoccus sp. G2-2]
MEFQNLLDPVSKDAPSGVELRNDARFHAIERLLEPASRASKFSSDGVLDESVADPEWQEILDQSLDLAKDGRDLRLLVIIARAASALEDFEGLAQAITLLTETIDAHWDTLHPALRARDDPKAAALPRINALKQLENDDNGLLGDLKYSILLNIRGVGAIPGIYLAQGSRSEFEYLAHAASGLNESEKADLATKHGQIVGRVNAACRALAAEQADIAAGTIAAISACEAAIVGLGAKLSEKLGLGSEPAISLSELGDFLAHTRASFEAGVAAMANEDGSEDVAETSANTSQTTVAAPSPLNGSGTSASVPGVINSRRDVEKMLDSIVAFYERTEPSSPIPHMARRMRRMVAMDFLELMEEIAPSGLKEFGAVAGVEIKKK